MRTSARVHAPLPNMQSTKIHLNLPHGGNNWNIALYILKLLLPINRAEWMKGICLLWSRGRHFSPSLPGDRYLNLGSPQKRPPGRNLGEHRSVRRSGTASRGTVVLPLCLRMRGQLRAKVTIFVGKKYPEVVMVWHILFNKQTGLVKNKSFSL